MLSFLLDQKLKEERLKGLVLGTVVGAAIGVLFAPYSGEETRNQIVEKSKEGLDYAQNVAADAKDAIQDSYNDMKVAAQQKGDELKMDAEVAKAKAAAIGDVIREEGEVVKDELEKSKDNIADSAKNVKDEAQKEAKITGQQLKDSKEKIEKDVDKKAEEKGLK